MKIDKRMVMTVVSAALMVILVVSAIVIIMGNFRDNTDVGSASSEQNRTYKIVEGSKESDTENAKEKETENSITDSTVNAIDNTTNNTTNNTTEIRTENTEENTIQNTNNTVQSTTQQIVETTQPIVTTKVPTASPASNISDASLMAQSDVQAAKYVSYFEEVIRLVNEVRIQAGVEPLEYDINLTRAACVRALEMDCIDQCVHERADGRNCYTAIDLYSSAYYSAKGENIGAGFATPEKIVNAWKNSQTHYKNMISASYTRAGVGYSNEYPGVYSHYWAMIYTSEPQ